MSNICIIYITHYSVAKEKALKALNFWHVHNTQKLLKIDPEKLIETLKNQKH